MAGDAQRHDPLAGGAEGDPFGRSQALPDAVVHRRTLGIRQQRRQPLRHRQAGRDRIQARRAAAPRGRHRGPGAVRPAATPPRGHRGAAPRCAVGAAPAHSYRGPSAPRPPPAPAGAPPQRRSPRAAPAPSATEIRSRDRAGEGSISRMSISPRSETRSRTAPDCIPSRSKAPAIVASRRRRSPPSRRASAAAASVSGACQKQRLPSRRAGAPQGRPRWFRV